jgi:hypothetical protein
MKRIRAIPPGSYDKARWVGRNGLPSSVGGLLVHCADHAQRHVGQLVTTAKVVVATRGTGDGWRKRAGPGSAEIPDEFGERRL